MAKRDVEEEIRNLSLLREAPQSEATLVALRKGLGDRVNLMVAKTAQLAGELRLKTLVPEMVAAFERMFRNGAEMDPQCWAKNALAKALIDLDYDEASPFLRGCRYIQMEPVWGGRADTAVTLRSLCTLALVQCADLPRAEKLRHLVTSVSDAEETVRIDALRALEQMEGEEAALLLRLKAGVGDQRASVVGQAIESLLRVEGARALEFACGFLKLRAEVNLRELWSTAEEFVEEAALALGASRLPAAVGALRDAWTSDPRVVFLQAISASRQESGFRFLLDLVKSGRERDAAAALDALSLQLGSPEVRKAALEAVEERGSTELSRRFQEKFGAEQET